MKQNPNHVPPAPLTVQGASAAPITVIAVHGNGGGGFRFSRVPQHLPPDVRLEAISLPGFDGIAPHPTLRTLADYADHVAALCRKAAPPRVALGTGTGGTLLIEMAQRHPAVLDGLILHAPVGAHLERRRFPQLMRLPGAAALGQRVLASPLARPLWQRLLFDDYRRVPPVLLDRFFSAYEARQCAAFPAMFALITPGWFRALEPCRVPTALLWGQRERMLRVTHLEDYKRLFPNHLVRVIPAWDHFPMLEQPDAYAHEVADLARKLTIYAG